MLFSCKISPCYPQTHDIFLNGTFERGNMSSHNKFRISLIEHVEVLPQKHLAPERHKRMSVRQLKQLGRLDLTLSP